MHKRVLVGFLALLVLCAIAMGLAEGQPRPYGNKKAGCDTINDSVTVGVDWYYGAWYFYCWLDDSASGVGYLTRFMDGSAIETCTIHLRPGHDFVSFATMDSVLFEKADSSDIFCYEIAQ